jgi:hypothetical protein
LRKISKKEQGNSPEISNWHASCLSCSCAPRPIGHTAHLYKCSKFCAKTMILELNMIFQMVDIFQLPQTPAGFAGWNFDAITAGDLSWK